MHAVSRLLSQSKNAALIYEYSYLTPIYILQLASCSLFPEKCPRFFQTYNFGEQLDLHIARNYSSPVIHAQRIRRLLRWD